VTTWRGGVGWKVGGRFKMVQINLFAVHGVAIASERWGFF